MHTTNLFLTVYLKLNYISLSFSRQLQCIGNRDCLTFSMTIVTPTDWICKIGNFFSHKLMLVFLSRFFNNVWGHLCAVSHPELIQTCGHSLGNALLPHLLELTQVELHSILQQQLGGGPADLILIQREHHIPIWTQRASKHQDKENNTSEDGGYFYISGRQLCTA